MIYLGQRPDGPFDANIRVKKNTLKVLIMGKTRVNERVSYWSKYQNYFKAGGTWALGEFCSGRCCLLTPTAVSPVSAGDRRPCVKGGPPSPTRDRH